eukprot:GGOE01006966.1.p1 GENE.GGOE01006966.1~~GGOE01006966.1.p1  ORF type:complete len:449 (+),score=61.71 GGOE01006966.1:32-1348(+)
MARKSNVIIAMWSLALTTVVFHAIATEKSLWGWQRSSVRGVPSTFPEKFSRPFSSSSMVLASVKSILPVGSEFTEVAPWGCVSSMLGKVGISSIVAMIIVVVKLQKLWGSSPFQQMALATQISRKKVLVNLEEGVVPLNTFGPKAPFVGKVQSVEHIVGPDAANKIWNVVIETNGKMKYWEGQSCGVIPPGTKINSKGKEVPHGTRLYSIAASRYGDNFTRGRKLLCIPCFPAFDGNTMTLCVRQATYFDAELGSEDPAKKGICSDFLCNATPGTEVAMTGPTGKSLLLVKDPLATFICVATGTGIAPFRSFWRRMFYEDIPNYNFHGFFWLFMGVANHDALLYDNEIQEITLTYPKNFRVDYAFSREETNKSGGKMYIQDKVEENAEQIFDLFENGAHIYFCGKKEMMHGMRHVFRLDWEEYFSSLKHNNRWHTEVY